MRPPETENINVLCYHALTNSNVVWWPSAELLEIGYSEMLGVCVCGFCDPCSLSCKGKEDNSHG